MAIRPGTERTAVAFCGSSWRPARARQVVEAAVGRLDTVYGIGSEVLDLADAGPGLAAFHRDQMTEQATGLIGKIENADALIIGCPVFQGGYPGLFKHVFDQLQEGALRDVPVLLTACGGGLRHALVVEHQLRPLFGYFEAMAVPTAVYACSAEVNGASLAPPLQERLNAAVAQFAGLMTDRCRAA